MEHGVNYRETAEIVCISNSVYQWIADNWPHMTFCDIPFGDEEDFKEYIYIVVWYSFDLMSFYEQEDDKDLESQHYKNFRAILKDLNDRNISVAFLTTEYSGIGDI